MKNLLRSVNLPDGNIRFISLAAAEENGLSGLSTAPRSIRVLVENILRSSFSATSGDVAAEAENSLSAAEALISASSGDGPVAEVSFRPTRLILQDHSGIPVLADMASLRSLMAERGLDPRAARPALPVDLVVDHSVEVASWARPDALRLNMGREYHLNRNNFV